MIKVIFTIREDPVKGIGAKAVVENVDDASSREGLFAKLLVECYQGAVKKFVEYEARVAAAAPPPPPEELPPEPGHIGFRRRGPRGNTAW